MRAAYERRRRPAQRVSASRLRIVGDLLKAEIAEKQARRSSTS